MLSFLNGRMLAPLSREASLPPPPSPHGRFIWAVDGVGGREAGGGTLRLGHEWRRKGNKVKGERPSRPKVSVPVPAARTASCPSGSKRPWPFRREGAGGGMTACCAGRRGMDQGKHGAQVEGGGGRRGMDPGKLGAQARCLLATSSQQSLSATRLSRATPSLERASPTPSQQSLSRDKPSLSREPLPHRLSGRGQDRVQCQPPTRFDPKRTRGGGAASKGRGRPKKACTRQTAAPAVPDAAAHCKRRAQPRKRGARTEAFEAARCPRRGGLGDGEGGLETAARWTPKDAAAPLKVGSVGSEKRGGALKGRAVTS